MSELEKILEELGFKKERSSYLYNDGKIYCTVLDQQSLDASVDPRAILMAVI